MFLSSLNLLWYLTIYGDIHIKKILIINRDVLIYVNEFSILINIEVLPANTTKIIILDTCGVCV